MTLPADFNDFIEPQALRHEPDWLDLLPIGDGNAPFESRFYVIGFRKAAASQGFYGANQLWDFISDLGKKKATERAQTEQRLQAAVNAIIGNAPAAWKKQLPDPHDRGAAKLYNTYWKEFGLSQLLRTWRRERQTLPKALLSIAALHLAMRKKGVLWADVMKATPITIRPSVYWLVDYTEAVHSSTIEPNARDCYRACGLSFDVGVKQKSAALQDAAQGHSLTYSSASALRDWLHAKNHTECGPLRIIESKMRKQPPAQEVFCF